MPRMTGCVVWVLETHLPEEEAFPPTGCYHCSYRTVFYFWCFPLSFCRSLIFLLRYILLLEWGLEEMGEPGASEWFTLVRAQYTHGFHFVNLARYRNCSSEWEIDVWGLSVSGSVTLNKLNSINHHPYECLNLKSSGGRCTKLLTGHL